MRRILLKIALLRLSLFWGLLSAAVWPAIGATIASNAVISCSEAEYDFGKVLLGKTVEHTFMLKNDAHASLVITGMTACCGTELQLSTNIVTPGESVSLKATVHALGNP